MNQDISDIALVSSEMSWSNVYDADTLRRLSAQMEGTHGLYSFGFLSPPSHGFQSFPGKTDGLWLQRIRYA